MKLTVLGGAAACPNPGQGSAGYLLEFGGTTWLIDCGPNILQELRKHTELDRIDRILISHVHSDHTLDLVPFRYGLKYAPGMKLVRPVLSMPPGGRAFLNGVANAWAMGSEGTDGFFEDVFEIVEYDPTRELTAEQASVEFMRTNHPVPCWAMRIEHGGQSVVYLADTGPQDDLLHFSRNADILICEGTYPSHVDVVDMVDRPHLSAFEAGQLARDAEVRHFVLTHLWATAGLDRYREEAKSGAGRSVRLAEPGLTINLDESETQT